MISKDSSKHIICARCSAEADPAWDGPEPLCRLHAGTWKTLSKQASDEGPATLRELANTGDVHNANGRS